MHGWKYILEDRNLHRAKPTSKAPHEDKRPSTYFTKKSLSITYTNRLIILTKNSRHLSRLPHFFPFLCSPQYFTFSDQHKHLHQISDDNKSIDMSVHLKPGKMPYRYFGRSGLQTSVISLGNMINTKEETYPVDEQIIKVALENGINHFDTA